MPTQLGIDHDDQSGTMKQLHGQLGSVDHFGSRVFGSWVWKGVVGESSEVVGDVGRAETQFCLSGANLQLESTLYDTQIWQRII